MWKSLGVIKCVEDEIGWHAYARLLECKVLRKAHLPTGAQPAAATRSSWFSAIREHVRCNQRGRLLTLTDAPVLNRNILNY